MNAVTIVLHAATIHSKRAQRTHERCIGDFDGVNGFLVSPLNKEGTSSVLAEVPRWQC